MNVLVIEDDPLHQDLYRLVFKKVGINLEITESADEVMQKLDNDEVDIIIMDVNLRNTRIDSLLIDGIKFCRLIKTRYHYKKIPVILVTAYSQAYFGDKLLDDSLADDYFIKPITDFNKLLDKINTLVKHGS